MIISIETYKPIHQEQCSTLISTIAENEFGIILTDEQKSELEADIQTFHDKFWVAMYDQKVIGTIGLKIIRDFAVIRKLFVHYDFRGAFHGTAHKLLNILELECESMSIHKIYLGTRDVFKSAHRFYEKNEYVEITVADLPPDFPQMNVDTKFYFKDTVPIEEEMPFYRKS